VPKTEKNQEVKKGKKRGRLDDDDCKCHCAGIHEPEVRERPEREKKGKEEGVFKLGGVKRI